MSSIPSTYRPLLILVYRGINAPRWGWNGGNGLATIFAGFGIAPGIAGGFGAVVFLLAKYGVLKRTNSAMAAIISGPFWFFTAVSVCFRLPCVDLADVQ